MSVAVADVRTLFNDIYQLESLTGTQFARWLARAVRLYSRYNPAVIRDELETEVGKAIYELPDDCMMVKSVLYKPDSAANDLSLTDGALHRRRGFARNRPSELLVDQWYDQTGLVAPRETWTVESGYIIFEEGFAAVETLELIYCAEHALDEEGETYDTIPAQDIDILADLVLADILEHKAANVGATEDYAEGLERITVSNIVPNATASVESLRSGLLRKYGPLMVIVA